MEERAKAHPALWSVFAEDRRLVSETQGNLRDLDQLWAARKDAMSKATGPEMGPRTVEHSDRQEDHAPGELESQHLILIVDDDQDDFVLLERALRKADAVAPITWAQDGGEALEILSRFTEPFQSICVVVDIQLPDMDGFELVEAIRARQLPVQVRFVFITGNPNPQFETRARACGADGFFVKPCRHSDFLEIAYRLNELCTEPAKA